MGNTPNLALPYPEDTEPLGNMSAAVQALATALDALTYRPKILRGTVTFTIVTTGTTVVSAISFPAGVFAAAPRVMIAIRDPASNAPQNFSVGTRVITATACDLLGVRVAGAAASLTADWIAVGS